MYIGLFYRQPTVAPTRAGEQIKPPPLVHEIRVHYYFCPPLSVIIVIMIIIIIVVVVVVVLAAAKLAIQIESSLHLPDQRQ